MIKYKHHIKGDSIRYLKTSQYKYTVLFPKDITSFRFYLYTPNPSGDRNKGRIVLNNINLVFNEHKFKHL